MANKLAIRPKLSKRAQAELDKTGSDIRPGDVMVNVGHGWRGGQICRVLRMTTRHVVVVEYSHGAWDETDRIEYEDLKEYRKIDGDPVTLESDVLAMMKDVEGSLGLELAGATTDETALAISQGKEPLLAAERTLQAAQNKALIARAVMMDKVEQIAEIVHRFEEGLTKVRKVLHVGELYLGIGEEIHSLREGAPAPATEPISIRQMILYMDEEVGDPWDGGLDWEDIDCFDEWVAKAENTARVLPERKGVVALQVRRHMKEYACSWEQVAGNAENSKTYLLIRNGDRLYRIWMDEHIKPRLFPRKDEFCCEHRDWSPFDEKREWERDFSYKKYGAMLQGLIHRTDVFHPLERTIDLFEPRTWNGLVRFIRDDELTLSTGRLPWRQWQKQINEKICVGSRVVWMDKIGFSRRDEEIQERTGYTARIGVCAPECAVYTVVAGPKGRGDCLRFLYDPGDTVWCRRDPWTGRDLESGPRKRRVGFRFERDEVLNYDQIELADIEFYIHCRTERGNYVDMMPLLWTLYHQRQAEMEHEKGLVDLLIRESSVPEKTVWDAIDWWKYKNKWKRPVSQDDAKALRMIRRKLRS